MGTIKFRRLGGGLVQFSAILALAAVCTVSAYGAKGYGIALSGKNKFLNPGGHLRTASGYSLVFQKDANLVLYSPKGKPIWATGCRNSKADRLVFQGDGNVVLYARGRPIWATNTDRRGRHFVLQNSGNMVVVDNNGRVVWSSGTARGRNSSHSAASDWGGGRCGQKQFRFDTGNPDGSSPQNTPQQIPSIDTRNLRIPRTKDRAVGDSPFGQ